MFRVWTKRAGNNPRLKVLLPHGGPGSTHEYFEAFDSFFPRESLEYYQYDHTYMTGVVQFLRDVDAGRS